MLATQPSSVPIDLYTVLQPQVFCVSVLSQPLSSGLLLIFVTDCLTGLITELLKIHISFPNNHLLSGNYHYPVYMYMYLALCNHQFTYRADIVDVLFISFVFGILAIVLVALSDLYCLTFVRTDFGECICMTVLTLMQLCCGACGYNLCLKNGKSIKNVLKDPTPCGSNDILLRNSTDNFAEYAARWRNWSFNKNRSVYFWHILNTNCYSTPCFTPLLY